MPGLTGLTHKLHGFGHCVRIGATNTSNRRTRLTSLICNRRPARAKLRRRECSIRGRRRPEIDRPPGKVGERIRHKAVGARHCRGNGSAIVAAHLVLDRADRIAAFVISAMLVGLTVGLAFYGSRPGPPPLARSLMLCRPWSRPVETVGRELLEALVSAYTANRSALESKADTYQQARSACSSPCYRLVRCLRREPCNESACERRLRVKFAAGRATPNVFALSVTSQAYL